MLVAAEEAAALATALRRLLSHPAIGKRAREVAMARYSVGTMTDRLFRVSSGSRFGVPGVPPTPFTVWGCIRGASVPIRGAAVCRGSEQTLLPQIRAEVSRIRGTRSCSGVPIHSIS